MPFVHSQPAAQARSGRFALLRSLVGQVTFSALLVSLVSTLALFMVVTSIVRSNSEGMLQGAVNTDLAGLSDIFAVGGRPELAARVADRLSLSTDDGETAYYLVADGNGQRVAGNIDQWPELSSERSESGYVTVMGDREIFARATQLSADTRLVVGRSFAARQALVRQLAISFALTGLVVALLSLIVGYAAAVRLQKRVDSVNATFAAIRSGNISTRAPGAESKDELGELADNTNRMLDQVNLLVDAQRNVSDQTAHEIRTPLMHLDTRIWKAMERTVDPEMTRMLGKAREEIKRVIHLLDSLLDIAGTEALRGDLRGLPPIDLSDIAENLADLYGASAEDLGLTFLAEIAPNVSFRADSMQMMRLMSNLLDNAFKYVPRGGTVRLRVDVGPRIIVEDNGSGIPVTDRERVFERYARLEQPAPEQPVANGHSTGHGLGLALARAIASRHGLKIHVADADPGARFVVEPEGAYA